MKVTSFSFTERFQRELNAAPPDVQRAARDSLQALLENPRSVRAHRLKGYKPAIFSMDAMSNHAWQISFELNGTDAKLIRLGTHKQIDRAPR